MRCGILFDLDGTLLDTLDDLTNSTNYALAQFGYPPRTRAEVRAFIGNGARKLIACSVPEGKDPEAVLKVYQEHYASHCQLETKPYPGILEALAELGKRYPIAIVSNKPDRAVKPLCEQYFPGIFARGESVDCPRKPKPDMLYKAMESIGVDACIYVGDSEVDVLTARNAGTECISVLWGFRDEDDIVAAGGNHLCHSAEELVAIADQLMAKLQDNQ